MAFLGPRASSLLWASLGFWAWAFCRPSGPRGLGPLLSPSSGLLSTFSGPQSLFWAFLGSRASSEPFVLFPAFSGLLGLWAFCRPFLGLRTSSGPFLEPHACSEPSVGFWASSQPFRGLAPLRAFCRPFLGFRASSGPFLGPRASSEPFVSF